MRLVNRLNALGGRVGENFFQKRQTRRTLAFEHAAFGPPENLVIALVGFAVAAISAGDGGVPKAEDKFLGAQSPPALRNVAFVLHFVIDDRLVDTVSRSIRARAGLVTAPPFWMLACVIHGRL